MKIRCTVCVVLVGIFLEACRAPSQAALPSSVEISLGSSADIEALQQEEMQKARTPIPPPQAPSQAKEEKVEALEKTEEQLVNGCTGKMKVSLGVQELYKLALQRGNLETVRMLTEKHPELATGLFSSDNSALHVLVIGRGDKTEYSHIRRVIEDRIAEENIARMLKRRQKIAKREPIEAHSDDSLALFEETYAAIISLLKKEDKDRDGKYEDIISYLVGQARADINASDNRGRTPLDTLQGLKQEGHYALLNLEEVLIKEGGKNKQIPSRRAPLYLHGLIGDILQGKGKLADLTSLLSSSQNNKESLERASTVTLNEKDVNGNTPLHVVLNHVNTRSRKVEEAIFKALIACGEAFKDTYPGGTCAFLGLDVNNNQHHMPLHLALLHNKVYEAQELIRLEVPRKDEEAADTSIFEPVPPPQPSPLFSKALILAIQHTKESDAWEIAKHILAKCPHALRSPDQTPLHWAIYRNMQKVVEYFLEEERKGLIMYPEAPRHSMVNVQEKSEGYTPLIAAILSTKENVINVILKCEAIELDLQDNRGLTALHWGVLMNEMKTIEAILHKVDALDRTEDKREKRRFLSIRTNPNGHNGYTVLDLVKARCKQQLLPLVRGVLEIGNEHIKEGGAIKKWEKLQLEIQNMVSDQS